MITVYENYENLVQQYYSEVYVYLHISSFSQLVRKYVYSLRNRLVNSELRILFDIIHSGESRGGGPGGLPPPPLRNA